MRPLVRLLARSALAAVLSTSAAHAAPTLVYSTDFEAGLPHGFEAPGCTIEGVQGYAGLGPAGRPFGGNFLRYTTTAVVPTSLVVRNLPPHDRLDVRFLLAIIDSWDSTEIFEVRVDDALLFAHRFSLALADTTTYSPAPPGTILSMGTDLGFTIGSYYGRDRAYDLGADPAFLGIPHTADSVTVRWSLSAYSGSTADAWQGGGDESWGIDAVRIETDLQSTDVGPDRQAGRLAVAAWPNPALGHRVRLVLSLAAGAAARVELLDVTGRRVDAAEIAGGPARSLPVELASGKRLAPGLYFARLTQEGASRTARVVIAD